jgi:hypothetical protein
MQNNIIIIALLVNGVISYLISTMVKNREISQSKVFWISFLLSPIVGMFAAMMSPEVKGETKEVINEGELDLPKYNKDGDELLKFIDNNLIYLLVGIVTIIFVTGLYK